MAFSKVRAWLKNHTSILVAGIWLHNRVLGRNRKQVCGAGNRFLGLPILSNCRISIHGHGNTIDCGPFSRLSGCQIRIVGNHNRIILGEHCHLRSAEFWMGGDRNTISVGDRTAIEGSTHLAATESTSIAIGEDCMFSSEIVIRTSDSHSLIHRETRERLNPACDVQVGNHVWLGHRVILLKGVHISDHSMVATGAIVTRACEQTHVVLAGIPAKVVHEDVDWLRERIP